MPRRPTLRLTPQPTSKRGTWMHEYSAAVWRRWVEAEIESGTINLIKGYVWHDWPEGIPNPEDLP